MHTTLFINAFAGLFTLSRAYTWPDPIIDDLEANLVQVTGFDSLGFADAVQPCGAFKGANNTGRQTAAEWLRIAFHDMATFNISTGLGGLDASIAYETTRPENVGAAMNGSLQFFLPFMSVRTSMSDLIALGTVTVVRSCGSEKSSVPLRAGRIDATVAGPPGVPEPQDSLETTTKKFAMTGFNVTEMIGLVACGHTIGGVHQEDFPNIVHNAVSVS
jgi:catalase (peroxidase I)